MAGPARSTRWCTRVMLAGLITSGGLTTAAGTAAAAVPGPVTYTDTSQVFTATVPAGVCAVRFTATGGSGGAGSTGAAGAPAGVAAATITVTAGETYHVAVGAAGAVGVIGANAAGGVSGGQPSGGQGGVSYDNGSGGGGGGASTVTLGADTTPTLVGAGGGGGGGDTAAAGGAGGNPGGDGSGVGQGGGGGGATATTAGVGGVGRHSYENGAAGNGSVGGAGNNTGDADETAGGGGGGGIFGGGGGAGQDGSGGGGGGANTGPTGTTNTIAATGGDGSVTAAFTACATAPVFTADTPSAHATTGTGYSYRFTASGTPNPTFTVASGRLPAGLTLNPTTGILSGTPTTPGTDRFTISATNTAGTVTTRTLTITTTAAAVAPRFTADTPPAHATAGRGYGYRFTATGTPRPTFTVTSGRLPAGLTLNPTTGILSGTPTTPGTDRFTVSATNIAGRVTTATLTITTTTTVTPPGPRPSVSAAPLTVLPVGTRRIPVTCRVTRGAIRSCAVTLTARIGGHRLIVGHGTRTLSGSGAPGHTTVTVALTAHGRDLAARVGGLPVTVTAAVRVPDSAGTGHAATRTRIVAQVTVDPQAVHFASGSATLTPADRILLTALRRHLSGVRVVVCAGYTDTAGDNPYNEALGLARARNTCAYLIAGTHLKAAAITFGETHPAATNRTPAGRSANRRALVALEY